MPSSYLTGFGGRIKLAIARTGYSRKIPNRGRGGVEDEDIAKLF